MGGNEATIVNPFIVNDKPVDIHITRRGSDWEWAVTSVMGVTFLAIIGASFLRPRTHRIFHYILAATSLVATIETFTLASNLGWTPINVEWLRSESIVSGVNRQIWYVRYIGWFITWPLLTLALLLTAAMPVPHIIFTSFLSALTAIMALVGALVHSTYKWGYYTFWLVAYLCLTYNLLWTSRRHAIALGRDVSRTFFVAASWATLLWLLYPVCWGVSEGGNVIAPDSEFIFYGVLDLCLIPVTSAWFLWGLRDVDPARLGVYLRDYNDPIPTTQTARDVHNEKAGVANSAGAPAIPAPAAQPATTTPADTTSTAV